MTPEVLGGAALGGLPVGMFECQRVRVFDRRMIGAWSRALLVLLHWLCAACLLVSVSAPPLARAVTWSTTKHMGSGQWSV